MKLEAIKSEQQRLFKFLKEFSDFYLAGGTALALQIGHRYSFDFDLFREKALDKSFISKIYNVFKGNRIKFTLRHSEQVNLVINIVKFNFVKYPYPLIFRLKKIKGVNVASPKEIALMKSFTLGRRARFKDYVDLYFILKERIMDLEEILKFGKKKYKDEFNGRLFLEELTYLEDVNEVPSEEIEFIKGKVGREEIKRFFEKEIKKIRL